MRLEFKNDRTFNFFSIIRSDDQAHTHSNVRVAVAVVDKKKCIAVPEILNMGKLFTRFVERSKMESGERAVHTYILLKLVFLQTWMRRIDG